MLKDEATDPREKDGLRGTDKWNLPEEVAPTLPSICLGEGLSPGLRPIGPHWKAQEDVLGKKGMYSGNSHERVSA